MLISPLRIPKSVARTTLSQALLRCRNRMLAVLPKKEVLGCSRGSTAAHSEALFLWQATVYSARLMARQECGPELSAVVTNEDTTRIRADGRFTLLLPENLRTPFAPLRRRTCVLNEATKTCDNLAGKPLAAMTSIGMPSGPAGRQRETAAKCFLYVRGSGNLSKPTQGISHYTAQKHAEPEGHSHITHRQKSSCWNSTALPQQVVESNTLISPPPLLGQLIAGCKLMGCFRREG